MRTRLTNFLLVFVFLAATFLLPSCGGKETGQGSVGPGEEAQAGVGEVEGPATSVTAPELEGDELLPEEGEEREEDVEFEAVKPLDTISQVIIIEDLPRYFLAGGWAGSENIFGLSGTSPVFYNLNNKSFSSPELTAWSASLSPDGQKLFYTNEEGAHLLHLNGSGHHHLGSNKEKEMDGGFLGGGLWSLDSKHLLFWYGYEWDTEFYVYSLESGEALPLQTQLEGYFLTSPVGWADEQRLVFNSRASRKKDGTQEYSFGYRSDLALYDLAAGNSKGNYKKITDADDGEFIEGISAGAYGIFYRRWFGDADGSTGAAAYYGVIGAEGGRHWEEKIENVMGISLSPDRTTLAYLAKTGQEGVNSRAKLVVKTQGKPLELAELYLGSSWSGPYWSPRGDKILLSFSASVEGKDKSYSEQYYTIVVSSSLWH